jgi:UDPglucose 6-dehydrogenase
MRLAVIGCGYVGLVTSGCLAYVGHDVVAADNDARRIEILQAGGMPIHEPGL